MKTSSHFVRTLFLITLFLLPTSAHADIDTPTATDVTASTTQNTAVTFTLSGISNDSNAGGALTFATSSDPTHGTLDAVASNGSVTYTPENGYIGNDSFSFIVSEGATSSAPATATITVSAPVPPPPPPATITVLIRDGSTAIGPLTIPLPASTTAPLSVTPQSGTTSAISVAADSALGIFEALDATHSEFDITSVQFFNPFSPTDPPAAGLFLNCVLIPAATSTPECNQWQYTVNGSGPFIGPGVYSLADGDDLVFYFGFPRQVMLTSPSVDTGVAFTATAQIYDPLTNTFSPATGVTIGVTQPDPFNPYSPLEIATSSVNASGEATFTLSLAGTYQVGIQEDYYFPTVSLDVATATVTTPSGGGGGGGGTTHVFFNISTALTFLSNNQNPDGSFSSPLYSDWAAIAFASSNPGTAKTKLYNHLLAAQPSMANITDYERHAMALQALGINPYTGTPRDYITPIVNAFDGTQIGDPLLDSDDIFAIFPLLHAGYAQSDPMIKKIVLFIMSKQKSDGSWDSNPDMTAAAIQAVGPFFTLPGYGAAMGKSVGYLKSTQKTDGGWGNVESTSWVMTALSAVQKADPAHAGSWTTAGGNTPSDSLVATQRSDGSASSNASASIDDRVWSTSYAVTAASGADWLTLLQSFSKPATSLGGGGAANIDLALSTSTLALASSTALSASTTQPIATSTVPTDATSTPMVALTTSTTSTSTPPVVRKLPVTIIKKRPTVTLSPSTTTPLVIQPHQQTALAAKSGGFLGSMWHAVISFFGKIF